jgi:DNA topoisomerase-1
MSFVSAEWWDMKASLSGSGGAPFTATLSRVGAQQVATSAQFDPNTGALKLGKAHLLLDGDQARSLCDGVGPISAAQVTVKSLERKASLKAPPPPFITSTLQQEANKRWGWSASQTMRVAQRLYESGFITYMRTDAPALASEAVKGIRAAIKARYGEEALPEKAKRYASKSKGAQEAHEAIRPSGTEMKDAATLKLKDQEARLYTLIWQRTMACQMSPAELSHTVALMGLRSGELELELRASGREIIRRGYLAAYEQKDDSASPLPPLEEGMSLKLEELSPEEHHTRPPARFSEASLVKALESEGVGRPSTYASIIDTIQRRGYVRAQGRQLAPTFTALAVTQLLERAFSDVVDLEFTASMEGWLDEIATGGSHIERLQSFYDEQLLAGVARGELLDPREICAITGPHFEGYEVRVGRFGPFIEYQRDDEKSTISLPEEVSPDEVSVSWIQEQLARAEAGELPLGESDDGEPIYVKSGRYGPYVQLGEGEKPKRSSLPSGLEPSAVTIEQARFLLSLPHQLGLDEEGRAVKVGLGRFGPYIQVEKVYASLKAEDDLFTVSLPRALELMSEKKSSSRGRADALKVLGEHPEGGEVAVYDGRYGPYVKHGKVNASLPKDQPLESLTLELALELIAKRAASAAQKKGAKTRRAPAKTAAKSSGKAKAKTKPSARSKSSG